MSIGRAPWRYTKCDPLDDEDRGDLPLDHDEGWESHTGNPQIIDADGNKIVGHGEYHVFGELNRVDNVRLLLAVPDLLAALIDCADALEDSGNYTELLNARAAIVKATGSEAAVSEFLRLGALLRERHRSQ